jgi:hypothetical protein
MPTVPAVQLRGSLESSGMSRPGHAVAESGPAAPRVARSQDSPLPRLDDRFPRSATWPLASALAT